MANCPRCDNPLRPVLVKTSTGINTAVEACLSGCAGIWVGREDLLAGLQPVVSEELLRIQQDGSLERGTRWDFLEVEEARRCGPRIVLAPEQLEKYIQCIRCGREMMRYRWNMTSPVVLDECPDGHGIWIDAGEVMQMRRFLQVDVADESKRAEIRGRLADVKMEYDRARAHRYREGSPLDWLFGILFRSDW